MHLVCSFPHPWNVRSRGFSSLMSIPSQADRCNALLTPDRDTLPPIRQTLYNSLALTQPDDTPIPPGRAKYGVSALPTRGSSLVLSRSLNSLPSSSTPHTGFGTPCVRNTLPSSYPTHWSSGDPGQRGDQVFPHRGPYESLQASEAAYSGFIHRPHFWNSDTAVPGGPDHLLTPNTSGGAVHYEAGPYPSYAGTRIERSSSRCDMPMAAQAGPHSGHQPLIIPGGVRRYACPPDISAPACYYSSPDYTVPFGTSIPRYPPHQKPLYHHHSVPSGASGSGQCSVPVDENRPSDVSQQRTLYHHHSIPSGASTSGQRLVPSVGPPNRGDEHNNGDQVKDCDQDSRYMTPQQSPTRQSVRHGRKGSSTSSTVLGVVDRRSIGLTKGHSDEQASESMGSVSKRRRRDSGESDALSCTDCPNLWPAPTEKCTVI